MCKTGQGKNLTYSSLWAKERDFLSFDQLIDEESMDFFQSDEYLMMSKHLNPSFSEGKVSFQVSLLFLVFGPLNQTGRLSGLASQPVPQTLGPQEDMKIWRIKTMSCPSLFTKHQPTSPSHDAVNDKMIHIFQDGSSAQQEKVLPLFL